MTLEEIVTEKRRVYTEKNTELDDFVKYGDMSDYAEYLNQLDILYEGVTTAFAELKRAEIRMLTAERNREIRKCLMDVISELSASNTG